MLKKSVVRCKTAVNNNVKIYIQMWSRILKIYLYGNYLTFFGPTAVRCFNFLGSREIPKYCYLSESEQVTYSGGLC